MGVLACYRFPLMPGILELQLEPDGGCWHPISLTGKSRRTTLVQAVVDAQIGGHEKRTLQVQGTMRNAEVAAWNKHPDTRGVRRFIG